MPLYLITSPQGKQYVGITTLTVNRRMTGHKTAARLGSPYPLHAAIRKYGFEAMTVSVLHGSSDLTELRALEVEAIAKLNTLAPNGYNLTAGGEGTLNHVVTGARRQHLSRCMSERWGDPNFVEMRKQKASELARSMSPAHRAALNAGAGAYWSKPENYARRAAHTALLRKTDPARFVNQTADALVAYNRSDEGRAERAASTKRYRAEQSPEKRLEIATLGVAARARKRAEREAYLSTLPPEEAARLRAEAKAKKSAETSAGRARATPEQKEASRERYRQAALRRHAAKKVTF